MQIHGPNGVITRVTAERYHPGAVALVFTSGEAVMRVIIYDDADADHLVEAAILARSLKLSETSGAVARTDAS